MIPPSILKKLADRLTLQTRSSSANWIRERQDLQRYTLPMGAGQVVVEYSPSRGGADTIELAVTDGRGTIVGSLVAEENEPAYDLLADLLFEIQRRGDPSSRQVTDEILRYLDKAVP